MRAKSLRTVCRALLVATVCAVVPALAQMPSSEEMEEAMREMQQAMEELSPEQRKVLEQALQQMDTEPAPGAEDDEITVPRRDAARIATVPKTALTGAQLKAHVEALQPVIANALTPEARERARAIETALRKDGGDTAAKLGAAANGLAAWGAWPEATYLMGMAALASGNAQDLNNLAAFLTMQRAGHAAVPILITLDARYPNNSTLLNNLGHAWFDLGEIEEAERLLSLAVRRTPNHPQANVTKSRIEEARGDNAAAIESMRMAIQGGFSEEKAQRLAKLGGKLNPGDLRWTMKLPADALGLSKFVPPPFAKKPLELVTLAPQWQEFQSRARAEAEKFEAQVEVLQEQKPWLADAAVRGPLTAKAQRMSEFDSANWTRRRKAAYDGFTDAVQFEQDASRKLYAQLVAIAEEDHIRCRHVPGGCDTCPQEFDVIEKYLQATSVRLDRALRDLLDFERQYTNEHLYYAQFTQSPRTFEFTVTQAKAMFLNVLQGPTLNDGPGLAQYPCFVLLKAATRSGSKLPDFDDINCEHIVHLSVPGFGSIHVRCNRMETTLDPIVLPIEASWIEDLNQDRVLRASAEIVIEGVTVGGHGEFDEQGLKSGGVDVGAGVEDSLGAGPLQVGVSAGGKIGIEFDRSGITDIRIEGGVSSKASATVASTPFGGASSSANAGVNSAWSWNAGTSASASGGFDATAL
jgi:tetratricopeptide (TPR) repeat protein